LQIISIGEVLWDVFEEKEFLGGAPLNFSAHAQKWGDNATLVTAVGLDDRGERALYGMRALGLNTEFVQTVREVPTGAAIIKTDTKGNASFNIARPAAFDCLTDVDALFDSIHKLCPDWIYFGTLAMTNVQTEGALRRIVECAPRAQRFYDMNLRTGHWNLDLIKRLSGLATVLKLNDAEAEQLALLTFSESAFDLEHFCRYWAEEYDVETICVTLGGDGCAVLHHGAFERFPGYRIQVADTVGAGDAFAAAFLHHLHAGLPMDQTARFANALGVLVASKDGATPPWEMEEYRQLIARQSTIPSSNQTTEETQ
jgi:fructokinase